MTVDWNGTSTNFVRAHVEKRDVCGCETAIGGVVCRVQILHGDGAGIAVAMEIKAEGGAGAGVVGRIGRVDPLNVEECGQCIKIRVMTLQKVKDIESKVEL